MLGIVKGVPRLGLNKSNQSRTVLLERLGGLLKEVSSSVGFGEHVEI